MDTTFRIRDEVTGGNSQGVGCSLTRAFAFSSFNSQVVAFYETEKIKRWDIESGSRLDSLLGVSEEGLMAELISFSPTGKLLAASSFAQPPYGSPKSELFIWNLDSQEVLGSH
jgi:WD40 repeat protein